MSDKEYIERGALLSRFKYPDRSVIIAQLQQDAFTDGLDSTAILKITDAVVAIRNSMVEAIKTTPTSDVEPVVRGEWEEFEFDADMNAYSCSACNEPQIFIEGNPEQNEYGFCPHCGAHMKMSEPKRGEHDEICLLTKSRCKCNTCQRDAGGVKEC